VGLDSDEKLVLSGDTKYREIWAAEDWCLKTAFENRPDWLSIQADMESKRYSFYSTLGDWLPTISTNGSYRYWTDELPFDEPAWSFGVSASYSFFSGFSRAANSRSADLRYQKGKLDVEQLRESIIKEVRSTIASLKNQQERVRLDKEFMEVRRRQLAITQLRYKSGQGSSSTLLRVRGRITDQVLRYWRAVFNARRTQARLARALGLESSELRVNIKEMR
jgi:outer membrane protein TolC